MHKNVIDIGGIKCQTIVKIFQIQNTLIDIKMKVVTF